ncbi:MAG: glycosyltransferase, partial [Flavobacteriaceae bacterium]
PGSMNNGISIAKGKYIARMDADDICTLNRIQKQVKLHEQHPNCAFVSAQRCLLSPIGIAYSQIPDVSDDSYCVETWEDLYYGTRKFTDASSLIMKAHIMAVGGYNTYQRSGMDVDLWFRIMEHTEADVLVLNEFLYQRRLIPEAITFSVNTNNTLVFDKAYERYKGKQAIAKHTINEPQRLKSYIRFLSTIAVHCWCVKDYSGAWAFLKKALSYKQFIYNSVVLNVFKKIYYFKITKPLQLING